MSPARTSLLLSSMLVFTPAVGGCETIDKVKGMATLMEAAGEHLEEDMKAPLSDDHIDMFLRVTPELGKFSETAKVKWKPDPKANDISQLSTSLGALGDYAAFFETQGTRITQYWVVTLKISDAVALLAFEEGQVEARKRLTDERTQLEQKQAAATGDEAAALATELERNQEALENLDEIDKARAKGGGDAKDKPYSLSPEEIALVKARRPAIEEALRAGGYADEKKREN
jgi:hypothetical protein